MWGIQLAALYAAATVHSFCGSPVKGLAVKGKGNLLQLLVRLVDTAQGQHDAALPTLVTPSSVGHGSCRNGYLKRQLDGDPAPAKRMRMEHQGHAGEPGRHQDAAAGIVGHIVSAAQVDAHIV